MKSPTPKQVKKSRTEAELIQTLTAQLIYKGLRIWQGWEAQVGEKGMENGLCALWTVQYKSGTQLRKWF